MRSSLDKKTVILYLLVPVVLFIFTVFVPLVTALVYSFFEWKGGPQEDLHWNCQLYNSFFRMVYSGRLLAIIFILSSPVSSVRSVLPLFWF